VFRSNDVGAEMDWLAIEYPSSINDGRLTSGAKTQGDYQQSSTPKAGKPHIARNNGANLMILPFVIVIS